jgi:hypothetical protein
MSTEAPVAPAVVPNTEQPRVVVPPSNTVNSSAEKAHQNARDERIKTAMAPKTPPVEAAKPATEPVKAPAVAEAPKIFTKTDALAPAEVTADPVEKMRLPENASQESVVRFSDLSKIAKERKAALDLATRELTELRSKAPVAAAPNPAELAEQQAKEARLKAAEDRLAIVDLENHPTFTAQFTQPLKQVIAVASEVIAYNEKTVPDVALLLAKPMKEFNATISELTKDMNQADAATVMQSLRQARDLNAQKAQALTQSSELRTQLQAKTQLEQKRAFESVAGEIVPSFAKMEVAEGMSPEAKQAALDYNQSVETLRARAETRAFGKVSERDVARMAFADVALEHMTKHAVPALERHVNSQNEVIAALTAELEGLRGKRAPSSLTNSTAPAGQVDVSKMSIEERVKYRLSQSRQPARGT